MTITVFNAKNVITMDPKKPRAKTVAVDDSTGRILAVGDSVEDLQVKADNTVNVETLLPGFIDPHSHRMLTSLPSHYIFPLLSTWENLVKIFQDVNAKTPAGEPVIFFGYDKLMLGRAPPTNLELDEIFGKDRAAFVLDNSGHAMYVSTKAMIEGGFDPKDKNVENPVGAHFGRNPDNTLNGQGFETAAVLRLAGPALKAINNPLQSGKGYYNLLSKAGITTAGELTFAKEYKAGYEALANTPGVPCRIVLYHMSTEPDCAQDTELNAPKALLFKRGVKLWADGSPWVGNIANSFPYLDSPTTRLAGIMPDFEHMGIKAMNYTLDELKAILDKNITEGKGKWQFSFHCNGDLAIATSLDAYEYALKKYNLLGTDHRWRLEHLGAGNKELFERAAKLGVTISLGAFQFYYWGDLLNGKMFESKFGSQWISFKDAFSTSTDVHASFHNDGMVSPPSPLINVQAAVSRTTKSGQVQGPEQKISLDDALKAVTVNPAWQLGMEDDIGTIEVGKFADFVVLSKDPYSLTDLAKLVQECQVVDTFLSGKRIDHEAFFKAPPSAYDGSNDDGLRSHFGRSCCSLPRRK